MRLAAKETGIANSELFDWNANRADLAPKKIVREKKQDNPNRVGRNEYRIVAYLCFLGLLYLVFAPVALFFNVLYARKRLHDFGASAAWAITPLAAIVGFVGTVAINYAVYGKHCGNTFSAWLELLLLLTYPIFNIVLALVPGDPMTNRYGPPPKDEATKQRQTS